MVQKAIKLLFFPQDDQYWRIDWFGDISYPSQFVRRSTPSIRVALSPLPDANIDAAGVREISWTKQQQVYAPVGYLGKLKIGDIWRNGELVASLDYCKECFKDVSVCQDTTSIIKAGVSTKVGHRDVFYLPLILHPCHTFHTGSFCALVNLDDGKRLIIPAVELIRFYFGSSSGLIHALFHFPLMPGMLWTDAQRGDGHKKAKINLALGISGWSASDVARIAFNPYAWNAAQLVGNSLSAAKAYRQALYPKGHFPFVGITTLKASGIWLPFGNKAANTFLVFKLLSCSHHFPFRGLEYLMAGAARKSGAGDTNRDKGAVQEDNKPQIAKRTSKECVQGDPTKGLATTEVELEKTPQFPDLKKKTVFRSEETNGSASKPLRLPGKPVNASSVGADGSEQHIRPVDFVRRIGREKVEVIPAQLMHDLVAELDRSGQFDKVEVIKVVPDEEEALLSCFADAIWRHNGGAMDLALRKRLPAYSNIQVAALTSGNMAVFLLFSETNRASRFSPLCVARKPQKSEMTWSIIEDVKAALIQPKIAGAANLTAHESPPHFISIQNHALEKDYYRTLKLLSSLVELYCGFLLD